MRGALMSCETTRSGLLYMTSEAVRGRGVVDIIIEEIDGGWNFSKVG